jgi:D-alanine-D-alanine ligase
VRVAVLRGGRSSEHEVSLRSGASVGAGLREAGHEVIDVVIERDGRWLVDGEEIELRAAGGLAGCDAAFPVLHGPYGEDGTVQGALEVLGVPFAGPTVLAAAITMDKITFKRIAASLGIPQVGFCQALTPGWRERAEALGLPVWVKPARLGSSVGIKRVDDWSELEEAVSEAHSHDPLVIIEAHAEGREIECAVLGNAGIGSDRVEVSQPGEIVYEGRWYDYEAKYSAGGMDLRVPADVDEATTARLRDLAEQVYRACGCTGLARCDFFLSESGEVLVNEINTIPGFTETSVYGKLWEASGLPYPELCSRLVELALERAEAERGFSF